MWSGRLGNIAATRHRIEILEGAKLVNQPVYTAGQRNRDSEKVEIGRMLAAKVIEPSKAEWAIPIVVEPKTYVRLRLRVDYRKLNAVTRRDSYPIPRMDESIDSLGESQIFATLDCNSGYWQVGVDEPDRDQTTFSSHSEIYRSTRLPFGLRNALERFLPAVDIILARVK